MFDDDASRVVAVVLGVVVLIGLGFVMGRYTIEEPSDPALGLAQDAGLAIPAEQKAAFFDGVVTTQEVEDAAHRFVSCASDAGVLDFTIEVSEWGWQVEMDEHSSAASECENRYFRTTALVWSMQRAPNAELDPTVTTSLP